VDLRFTADVLFIIYYLFVSPRYLQLRLPIGTKFCTVIRPTPNFIKPVQNFKGLWHKKTVKVTFFTFHTLHS